LLLDRWQRAREGHGQALIAGEAGIGKSRLLHTLRTSLVTQPHVWLESHSSPYMRESAFHPLIELVASGLGCQPDEADETKLGRLEAMTRGAAFLAAAVVPYLAALLSLESPERDSLRHENPPRVRQRTMEALITWISALAKRQPTVLLVEDLHWCDASTVEFFGQFLAENASLPVLVLLSFRPDFEPPWPRHPHVTHLKVSRLHRRQAELLIHRMIRDHLLPDGVTARIVERADGVPIFLEELTKAVLESGALTNGVRRGAEAAAGSQGEFPIPATLQDSLMERLDRLGTAKEVAQLGATLGREFSYDLLAAVASLGSDRLARHYSEAGLGEAAIPHWQRAGQRALERSACVEAISHLSTGLELLAALPDTSERGQQELALQLPLGTAYLMSRGYAVPGVGTAYRRAYDLCQKLGDAPEQIPALFGLWRFYMARPDYRTARQLSEQLLGLAEQTRDAAHLVLAHYALGSAFHLLGDPRATRTHMEEGLRHYDPEQHRSLANRAGFDPAVTCHAVAAHALWELGYAERARAESQRALALAETLAHFPTLAFAVLWNALLAAFGGDALATRTRSEQASELCRDHGLASFLAMSSVLRGWARSETERGARIAEIQQNLSALRSQGTELF